MISVLVQITVEDFDRFIDGFRTRGFALRQRHGSKRARVFRHADDPARVSILFDWESRQAMEGFLADPEVMASMKTGGTVGRPAIAYLDRADDLPA